MRYKSKINVDLSEVMSLNIGCQTFYHLKTGSFHDSINDIVIFIVIVARIGQENEIIIRFLLSFYAATATVNYIN